MTSHTSATGSDKALLNALASAPEHEWLSQGRSLAVHGQVAQALVVWEAAVLRFPDSSDVCLGLAGVLWQSGDTARAEEVLRGRLEAQPDDEGAAFLLASLLREQGRLTAVGKTLLSLFAHGAHDVDAVIRAIEMLDDYGRPNDALTICENAIDNGADDPRLHAYAGMLGIQLGRFEQTREHYARALAQTDEAVNWAIPSGLAALQRYTTSDHPDFAFFHALLQQPALAEGTRRDVLFALGKAHDDIGDVASASLYFRQANSMAGANRPWSRKHWKRSIEARLAATPIAPAPANAQDWTPVFIVGVPRSGTTLLAQRLGRYPQVKNRGELGWLEFIEQRLSSTSAARTQQEDAASDYARQLLQDDAPARWYIDKQPLNLLRVDLAMSLWPNARIIHCERDARDTALSLWTQSFHDAAHDYSHDFGDIAAVIRDCRRLAAHWRARYPDAFLDVSYEAFVEAPDATLDTIARWLGLPDPSAPSMPQETSSGIATASAWQARQPVYQRSMGRWQRYAPHVPELLGIPTR